MYNCVFLRYIIISVLIIDHFGFSCSVYIGGLAGARPSVRNGSIGR
jgi:hypothetical protein